MDHGQLYVTPLSFIGTKTFENVFPGSVTVSVYIIHDFSER